MDDLGFIIFNDRLQILAGNRQSVKLLGGDDGSENFDEMSDFLQKHPRFNETLTKFRDEEISHFTGMLLVTLPDNTEREIQISLLKSGSAEGDRHIVAIISPGDPARYQNVHLRRSFKYNAVNKLSASVAHEIRNPLSSLAIQAEIMANTIACLSTDSEQQHRMKKSIAIFNSELERVVKIIDQFFKLSRPSGNEFTYEDVNSIVTEVFDLIRQQCYETECQNHSGTGKRYSVHLCKS